MSILQEKWLSHQIIGLDVFIDHEQVQEIDIRCTANTKLPQTFNKEYQLFYGKKFALNQLNSLCDDIWSEFQINDQLELADCFIFCGEGEMGNEGFIVKTDKNNVLQWMLFSTSSNPFLSIHTKDDLVCIKSTYNFYITFNILSHNIDIIHDI